jgi:hypothetical protein
MDQPEKLDAGAIMIVRGHALFDHSSMTLGLPKTPTARDITLEVFAAKFPGLPVFKDYKAFDAAVWKR